MKYQNLQDYLLKEIVTNSLNAGDKLPSVRNLATKFSYSKNTVIKAMNELEKNHIVYSIPQKGYFVTEDSQPQKIKSNKIDFLTAGPDLSFFSFDNLTHCSNQILANHQKEILSYGQPQGMTSLRKQILNYFQDNQVFTSLERIMITSGAQQAINILMNMPFPNGRENILVEQPTYSGILQAAKLTNRTILGIDISQNSIDFQRLEYLFKNNSIKFFYVMPRFQNPLGHSYTKKEQQKIVALANKYDVYIVEDDFLGDLDPDKKRDPLFSAVPSGRVIYLKSFSKVFLPSLRLAAVIVPTNFIDTFLEYKSYLDSYTSTISQEVLATFMANGMFKVHLKQIKKIYTQKMADLVSYGHKYLPDNVQLNDPRSGFYTSLILPRNINATILTQKLAAKNVLVDDVDHMFLPYQKSSSIIRISISQVDQKQIENGMKIIAQTIAEYDTTLSPFSRNFHM
ncbi:PLP-dependent aminotransferase family protein [Companilactobacillus kimchiensis]|uniref:HTH gntR-type domain-containing protein n=1 Tax=Companilactobacillus kimchiensis TaxID=993692 RepID=A0A0R2LC82_9LACO|nr:PLP-dependent aminotransferase family protein [Companilactobacillus kimchiensis]KRN99395.1 hypothetical protein IV57_GL002518 [Companilactobacillus kimchiensis]